MACGAFHLIHLVIVIAAIALVVVITENKLFHIREILINSVDLLAQLRYLVLQIGDGKRHILEHFHNRVKHFGFRLVLRKVKPLREALEIGHFFRNCHHDNLLLKVID